MKDRMKDFEFYRFINDFSWEPGMYLPDDYSFLYNVDDLRKNMVILVPEIIETIDDFIDNIEVGQYNANITEAKSFGKKHLKEVLKPLNIKYCGIAERNQKISRTIKEIGKRYVLDVLDIEYKHDPLSIFGRGKDSHFIVEP
jgi:hypothetical protein